MRFMIGTTTYSAADLDRLALKDILLLEQQTADLGHALKWATVERWTTELDALAKIAVDKSKPKAAREAAMAERNDHPGHLWVMALVIWASRRLAGEPITFVEAVDFPIGDLTFLPEPEDHKSANPTKARAPRKGSARAGK